VNSVAPAAQKYPIRSLEKGLQLLLLFDVPNRAVRLSEASRYLGVSLSTAHRLLAMLCGLSFVRQDPKTRAYYAGGTLLDLAQSLLEEGALVRAADEELQLLAKRTRETAVLAVLRGSESHIIALAEGTEMTRVVPVKRHLGTPAHATSAGKVLLAELTRPELVHIFARQQLRAMTPRTIAKRSALEVELATVRRRGYAMSSEEAHPMVASVATIMRGSDGRTYGAIALLAPPLRISSAVVPRLVEQMRRSGDRIAARFERSLLVAPLAPERSRADS